MSKRIFTVGDVFDTRDTKQKFNVLNRQTHGTTINTASKSRAKAISARKEALQTELSTASKRNKFDDARLGENKAGMSEEDKYLARFQAERARQAALTRKLTSGNGKYALQDEDELTHMGQSLSTMSAEQINAAKLGSDSDNSDAEGAGDKGELPSNLVKFEHFGGGDLEAQRRHLFPEKTAAERAKMSKDDIMKEIMAKSKFYRAQRHQEGLDLQASVAEMDASLTALHPFLEFKSKEERLRERLTGSLSARASADGAEDDDIRVARIGMDGKPILTRRQQQLMDASDDDGDEAGDADTAKAAGGYSDDSDDDFVAAARKLKFSQRAVAGSKLENAEDVAAVHRDRLLALERARMRRMTAGGAGSGSDADDADDDIASAAVAGGKSVGALTVGARFNTGDAGAAAGGNTFGLGFGTGAGFGAFGSAALPQKAKKRVRIDEGSDDDASGSAGDSDDDEEEDDKGEIGGETLMNSDGELSSSGSDTASGEDNAESGEERDDEMEGMSSRDRKHQLKLLRKAEHRGAYDAARELRAQQAELNAATKEQRKQAAIARDAAKGAAKSGKPSSKPSDSDSDDDEDDEDEDEDEDEDGEDADAEADSDADDEDGDDEDDEDDDGSESEITGPQSKRPRPAVSVSAHTAAAAARLAVEDLGGNLQLDSHFGGGDDSFEASDLDSEDENAMLDDAVRERDAKKAKKAARKAAGSVGSGDDGDDSDLKSSGDDSGTTGSDDDLGSDDSDAEERKRRRRIARKMKFTEPTFADNTAEANPVPFTFNPPKMYRDLAATLATRGVDSRKALADHELIVSRMRTLFNPKLEDSLNQSRSETLFRALFRHLRVVTERAVRRVTAAETARKPCKLVSAAGSRADSDDAASSVSSVVPVAGALPLAASVPAGSSQQSAAAFVSVAPTLAAADWVAREAFEISDNVKKFSATASRDFVAAIRTSIQERLASPDPRAPSQALRSDFPVAHELMGLRLVGKLYPVSDFRHNITTPLTLLLAECLATLPLRGGRDLAAGLFIAGTLLEYTQDSKRLVPEIFSFLQSALVTLCNLAAADATATDSNASAAAAAAPAKKGKKAAVKAAAASASADTGLSSRVAAFAQSQMQPRDAAHRAALLEPRLRTVHPLACARSFADAVADDAFMAAPLAAVRSVQPPQSYDAAVTKAPEPVKMTARERAAADETADAIAALGAAAYATPASTAAPGSRIPLSLAFLPHNGFDVFASRTFLAAALATIFSLAFRAALAQRASVCFPELLAPLQTALTALQQRSAAGRAADAVAQHEVTDYARLPGDAPLAARVASLRVSLATAAARVALKRRPLQKFAKPVAVREFTPSVHENFVPGRTYDSSREVVETKKLVKKLKRERKTTLREVRRATELVAAERLRETTKMTRAIEAEKSRVWSILEREKNDTNLGTRVSTKKIAKMKQQRR